MRPNARGVCAVGPMCMASDLPSPERRADCSVYEDRHARFHRQVRLMFIGARVP